MGEDIVCPLVKIKDARNGAGTSVATRMLNIRSNGMAEGIYEIHTGTNINTQAKYNYRQWCSPKGTGLIPTKYRVPGAAIFWGNAGDSLSIHHVAYLYKPVVDGHPEGDWYIIEARGVAYGVVMTKLNSRKPNYWGLNF